jgi:hypothetical protein
MAEAQGLCADSPCRRGDSAPELHWYEATGIGKREFKIKRIL